MSIFSCQREEATTTETRVDRTIAETRGSAAAAGRPHQTAVGIDLIKVCHPPLPPRLSLSAESGWA